MLTVVANINSYRVHPSPATCSRLEAYSKEHGENEKKNNNNYPSELISLTQVKSTLVFYRVFETFRQIYLQPQKPSLSVSPWLMCQRIKILPARVTNAHTVAQTQAPLLSKTRHPQYVLVSDAEATCTNQHYTAVQKLPILFAQVNFYYKMWPKKNLLVMCVSEIIYPSTDNFTMTSVGNISAKKKKET